MKKIILPVFVFLIASCSGGKTDKKAELERLKKEQAELTEAIGKLEKEIAKEDGAKATVVAKTVAVSEVVVQPFRHYVEVQGRIDGDENVAVSPKSPGTIAQVLVKEGQQVSKGQVLATMDNEVMVQGIEEAKTALAFAQSVYEKQKKLWDQKIGSEIQFLQAKNTKETLERKLATLNEQLEMTRIKSPINGTVDGVDVKIGQAVSPQMPAFRVVNFSKLKVVAEISEAYAAKVKQGNPVKITFPDLGKEIDAKLQFVGRVINPLNRTFSVEVSLNSTSPEFKPNMVAVLKINDYEDPSSVVVPVNVVQNSEEGNYVFVAKSTGNKKVAEKRKVVVGYTYDGATEIVEGLGQGDRLITQGYNEISNGQAIAF
jgi:membrane fusion protein, multidrug efflux system